MSQGPVQLVLAHLDFQGAGELRNVVLGSAASRPSSPHTGAIFFNSTSDRVEYFDGAAWQTLSSEVFTQSAHDALDHSAIASTIVLNELGEATASVSLGNQRIINLGTPSAATDAATKGYVDGQVSDEATARTAAVSAEQTARENADATLSGRVTGVEGQLAALDATYATDAQVTSAVNAERDARLAASATGGAAVTAALTSEAGTRLAADNALDARLDIVEGADTVAGSVAKSLKDAKAYTDVETARAQGQEAAIDTRFVNDEASIAANASAITAETTRATAAEAALASDISDVASDLAAETSARQSAVTGLTSDIATINSTISALDATYATDAQVTAAVAAETTARIAANTAGAAAVTTALTNEASTRLSADNALSGRLTTVEGQISNLDATYATDAEVSSAVSAEAALRTTAVAGVATDLTSEVTRATAAETALAGRVTTVEGTLAALDATYATDAQVTAAVAAETSARQAASAAGGAAVTAALTSEAQTRLAADNALDGRLDTIEANFTRKYAVAVGNGSATSFTVTHDLGTQDVTVSVREVSTGEMVIAKVAATSTSVVTVEFVDAPASGAFRVTVIG